LPARRTFASAEIIASDCLRRDTEDFENYCETDGMIRGRAFECQRTLNLDGYDAKLRGGW
jgi:hypothetical protein